MRRLPMLLVGAAALSLAAASARPPRGIPPIVFVSRESAPVSGVVPGLGPSGRTVVTRGRLLVRESDGRVRELLAQGAMLDVADPAVSPDARRIAFAGVERAGEPWRIWSVDVAGGGMRALTAPDPASAVRPWRADDFDPCWIDDRSLLFASTRWPQMAQYADVPATNLYVIADVSADPAPAPEPMTFERNGAEEPCVDPATSHVVFARWWYNRWLPGRDGPTLDPAHSVARESVNVWHAMETSLSTGDARLAAGDVRERIGMMGYQPAVMPDGAIVAVYAANLGLSPGTGPLGLHRLPRAGGPAERLAGALVDPGTGRYEDARGLAAPAACAPAPLADGRVVFSWSPGGRGDFGLYVLRPGDDASPVRLIDRAGTLELDAAPLVRRAPARGSDPWGEGGARDAPVRASPAGWENRDALAARFGSGGTPAAGTSVFHSTDIFGGAPSDTTLPAPPPRVAGARIRFYAPLTRPDAPHGEDLALLHEAPLAADGSVSVVVPATLPMFEEIVGADGRVLMGSRGPAHVAGSNTTRGRGTGCIGCHAGHSMRLPTGEPHHRASALSR